MGIARKTTITDLEGKININLPLALEAPEKFLSVDDYKLITDVYETIYKYKAKDWMESMSVTEMGADLMNLQASQVTIMKNLGNLTSYAEGIEDQLKITRAKVRMQAKALKQEHEKQGHTTAITVDDFKDLSYAKTEDVWKDLEQARIAANFVKYIYFSVKDHVTMLNYTIQRLSRLEGQ